MRTVAFCEIEPYCRAVLARHWPGVPIFGDIQELTLEALADAHERADKQSESQSGVGPVPATNGCRIDVICGGFPCQDISVAGKGAGLAGARSGLWREYFRLIRDLGPRYVIVENVSALLGRGLAEVLADLASIGFDAEWHCIPASHVGAPHRRDRIWIVAYPCGTELRIESGRRCGATGTNSAVAPENGSQESFAHSASGGLRTERRPSREGGHADLGSQTLADAQGVRLEGRTETGDQKQSLANGLLSAGSGESLGCDWWEFEPGVGRVAHGVSARVERLRALGNAVVPQVVEVIGKAIMRLDGKRTLWQE